ncbi:MAG: S9 family peptidase, partial [Deferrisomatales bacterium]
PVDGLRPAGEPRCVSVTRACDSHPRFLPDGRLAYLGMGVPGHESDRRRLRLFDPATGETRALLEAFDRNPAAFELAEGGAAAWLVAQDRGRHCLYRLDLETGEVRQLTWGRNHGAVRAVPGRRQLAALRDSAAEAPDLWLVTPDGGAEPLLGPGPRPGPTPPEPPAERLTRFGDALAGVEMHPAEELWFSGAGGDPVHGFLVRPPGFDPGRRYPLILLIHGGPQGAFLDEFHWRWSAQAFTAAAGAGACVALLNPRGSTGYGQAFSDQISGDWGGRCAQDLMLGLDHLLGAFPFLDPGRVAAAGASFGGFMIAWLLGHTDRFRALVCHAGIFNAEAMGYTTDELWFAEREGGGLPADNPEGYRRFSPHRFAGGFRTPTLVVHGGQDFRCPLSEGLGLYTALQTRGVESRLLYFPDEGHWVAKPANAEVWYAEVLGWLRAHLDG